MAETTNLKLQKPVDNDTTWGDDYRGAMDIIDEHPGIKLVVDATARLALTPWKGQVVCQLDTATIYKCTNDIGPVWEIVGAGAIPLTTKGDLLTYGTAAARLGVGTNGQVLTADSAKALGVKWASAPGASGVPERWYAPGSADEGFDDEFDDGSIDGWTAVNEPGKENSWYEPTGIKGLSCVASSGKSAHVVSGLLKSLSSLSAPCYVETAIKITGRNFGYAGAGLAFTDGVTFGAGTQVGVTHLAFNALYVLARHTNFNSRVSFSETTLLPYGAGDRLYMRLYWKAANTFVVYVSSDGVTWVDIHGDLTLTCTPTHFGLILCGHDGSTYPYSVNFAYFRARAGAPANG